MSTFRLSLAAVLAILFASTPARAQQPAESMSRFHASVRVSTLAGLVGHGPALSEDLPTPGFANRWHYLVGPEVAEVLRDLVGAPAVYTRVLVQATAKGKMVTDAEGLFRLEMTPAAPEIAEGLRAAAPGAELLWQQVRVLPAPGGYAEILIEEPSR